MADNILTYVINLQDNISSKLKTIGISSDTMLGKWAKIESSMVDAERSIKDTGRSIGSLNEKIAALKMQREWIPASNTAAIRATNHEIQRLEKEVKKLESLDGGKFKKWMNDITSSIPALVNPLTAIGAGMVQSVRKGMESELQKQNLATLLGGDIDAADTIFGKISEYGKNTVYDKAGLIEAQKTMMSFGISSDDAFSHLQQIGDIAMGDSQKMQSLALAFSQASSAGKLGGQDLMQMINAGFNPLQVISEKTGKTMAELKDEMSKGQITTEMMAQAFQWATEEGGMFYQGAEKAGQTLQGRMSKMKDSVDELLIVSFGAIEPVLSPLVDFATQAIGWMGENLQNLIGWFKEGGIWVTVLEGALIGLGAGMLALEARTIAVAAATGIKSVIDGIAAISTLGFKAAMDMLNLSFLACPVFWIVAGIVALIAVIIIVAKKTEGWGETFHNIMEFMKLSFQKFVEHLKLQGLYMRDGFLTAFEAIEIGWYKLQALWDEDSSAEALARIERQRDERAAAIAEAEGKIDELAAARDKLVDEGLWQVKWKSDEEGESQEESGVMASLQKMTNGGIVPQGGGTGGGTLNGTLGQTAQATATGGTRNTEIHINMGSMVENMIFNGGVGENRADIERQIAEVMSRVLGMAEATAG